MVKTAPDARLGHRHSCTPRRARSPTTRSGSNAAKLCPNVLAWIRGGRRANQQRHRSPQVCTFRWRGWSGAT